MAVSKITVKKSKVAQTVDLADLLGRAPTPSEAEVFAERAKELIVTRTQSNQDIDGDAFKNYTNRYANIKGVGVGEVDLTLFGDMLDSIRGDRKGSKVEIKIEGEQALKAYAHMTGYKGHPTIPQGKYVRKFFGLSEDEAETIAEDVKEFDTPADLRDEPTLDEILSRLGVEVGD